MPITPPKIHNVAPFAFDVTPSDTLDISSDPANALKQYANCTLLCKATGNLKVTTSDNNVLTFTAVPAYFVLPIQVRKVWSTGTTGSWVAMVCTNG